MNPEIMRAALLLGGGQKLHFAPQDAGRLLTVGADGEVATVYAGCAGAELTAVAELAEAAAGRRLAVGDRIQNRWTDTAARRSYENPLRVNHLCAERTENGTVIRGAWLQTQYVQPIAVRFSQYQAIMPCADGLAAGTYCFTFGETAGSGGFVRQGESFHFTLTQNVPAGGLLAGLRGCLSAASPYTTLKITVYAADRKTVTETADIAAGAGGTNLGTLTTAGNGILNGISRVSGGDNCWARSALRQYLNSDRPCGAWWTPQSVWDLAPDELESRDGYLCGMDPAVLALLRAVQVKTYTADGENTDTPLITCDRVTLPGMEEMFLAPEKSGAGRVQEYYRFGSADEAPYQPGTTHAELRCFAADNRKLAQGVRLRTAKCGNGCATWSIGSRGQITAADAAASIRYAPMMFIGG